MSKRFGAEKLDATVLSAGFWQSHGHTEQDHAKSLLNMDNAVNHWKNAAYGMAEETAKLEAELAAAQQQITLLSGVFSREEELQVKLNAANRLIDKLRDSMKLIMAEPINAEYIAEQALLQDRH